MEGAQTGITIAGGSAVPFVGMLALPLDQEADLAKTEITSSEVYA
jgi:hypothetical protein